MLEEKCSRRHWLRFVGTTAAAMATVIGGFACAPKEADEETTEGDTEELKGEMQEEMQNQMQEKAAPDGGMEGMQESTK